MFPPYPIPKNLKVSLLTNAIYSSSKLNISISIIVELYLLL
jgi:hypothetical protein